MIRARCIYMGGPKWECVNIEQVKQIRLTPFGYFNIEFQDGKTYSYDKLDMTND